MTMKPFFSSSLVAGLAVFGAVVSFDAAAAPIQEGCELFNVTISTIEQSPLNGENIIYQAPPPIYSTSCVAKDGNDSGNLQPAGANIGELNDGLLNGQDGIFSPTTFISTSDLLDLDGDGIATDPGWIYLGKQEAGQEFSAYQKPLPIDSILDFTLSCNGDDFATACNSGTWSLETYLNIVEVVQAVLGRSTFDHLAIVLKAGDEYIVYDFDFNIIAAPLLALNLFDYETPYSFTGTWNTNDLSNKKDISRNVSHVSLWARDPFITDNQVPVPGTLVLLGTGLLLLGAANKRKSAVSAQTPILS